MCDQEPSEFEKSVENLRKTVVDLIADNAIQLTQQLLNIAYDPEVDARVKLTAIGMLYDRAVPKLAVDSTKVEIVEESGSRKKIREEIEMLLAEEEEEDE